MSGAGVSLSGAAEMCLARLEVCLALELVSGAASVGKRNKKMVK